MNYIVLFFTHSASIKFENRLSDMGINVVIRPTPRALSSSCGVCADFKVSSKFDIKSVVFEDISHVYEIIDDEYFLIIENE
jgi:hypothetical protein